MSLIKTSKWEWEWAHPESVSIIERTWDKIVGKLDSILQSEE
jgi:hypothetical protein